MRVLIAGGGEVAALLARRLIREGNEIAILEQDEERCSRLEETLDARIVCGSAISLRKLQDAGLHAADMLIAVTSADEVNVLVCMAAQAESAVKVKIARLRTHEAEHWRRICDKSGLNIDLMIHPESETVLRILPVLRYPGVSDIVDFAGGKVKLFGMTVEPDSWVAGKSVEDLDRAGPPKHSLIALIFRGSQAIIPHGGEVIQPDDHIYIVTRRQDLDEVFRFMGVRAQDKLERVFVLGGKQLGIRIAEELEGRGVAVKLFERDAKRCEKIAGLLKRTVVVHADGTDASTLTDENINGVNAYLALTNDDEDNLIASMLARRLGARKVVALINRLNYLPMAQRLGISSSVSPRLATVDRILQFVRQGRVLSVLTFREEEAEAIELVAQPNSRYVNRPLKDMRLPREAIVGAIVRPDGTAIVPRGDSVIHPGDRAIFFTLEGIVPKLESAFLAEAQRGLSLEREP